MLYLYIMFYVIFYVILKYPMNMKHVLQKCHISMSRFMSHFTTFTSYLSHMSYFHLCRILPHFITSCSQYYVITAAHNIITWSYIISFSKGGRSAAHIPQSFKISSKFHITKFTCLKNCRFQFFLISKISYFKIFRFQQDCATVCVNHDIILLNTLCAQHTTPSHKYIYIYCFDFKFYRRVYTHKYKSITKLLPWISKYITYRHTNKYTYKCTIMNPYIR